MAKTNPNLSSSFLCGHGSVGLLGVAMGVGLQGVAGTVGKVNLTYLTFCQVLRIALLITSMDINNVTENSIINDIYKLDPKTAKIKFEA